MSSTACIMTPQLHHAVVHETQAGGAAQQFRVTDLHVGTQSDRESRSVGICTAATRRAPPTPAPSQLRRHLGRHAPGSLRPPKCRTGAFVGQVRLSACTPAISAVGLSLCLCLRRDMSVCLLVSVFVFLSACVYALVSIFILCLSACVYLLMSICL